MKRSQSIVKKFVIVWLLIVGIVIFFSKPKEEAAFKENDSLPEELKISKTETVQEPEPEVEWIPEAEVEEGGVYYGYDTLNEKQKLVYRQILDGFRNRRDEIPVTPLETSDEVFSVMHLMLSDRPEIFWYGDDGCNLDYEKSGEKMTAMTLKPSYSLEHEEIEKLSMQMDAIARSWIMEMPQGLSDYEKVKFMYEKLLATTKYEIGSPYNQDIRSVFLNGATVCTGYAKAFQYLMQLMDIPCCMVQGTAGGERHAWNLVQLNGTYYYTDVTWGLSGNEEQAGLWDYIYLCRDETFFSRSHVADETVKLPSCTDDSLNYYRQRNCYYEMYWDETTVRNILASSIRERKTEEVFAFHDEASYLTAKDILFNTDMLREIVDENYTFPDGQGFEWEYQYRDNCRSIIIIWTTYQQN